MINAVITETSLKIETPDTIEYSITFKDTNNKYYSINGKNETKLIIKSLCFVLDALGINDFSNLKGKPCEIKLNKNEKIIDINNFFEKHGGKSDY